MQSKFRKQTRPGSHCRGLQQSAGRLFVLVSAFGECHLSCCTVWAVVASNHVPILPRQERLNVAHPDKGTANSSRRYDPKLLHQGEVVFEMPVLGDQTVLHAVDVHRYEVNSLALSSAVTESAGR
jgi:hypothetical protein